MENIRNVSSVGLEHHVDNVRVTGSSPVRSTNLSNNFLFTPGATFLHLDCHLVEMLKYQVTIQFEITDDFMDLVPEHRTYINLLINNTTIDHYAVSMETQRSWITLNAASKKDVEKILKKSPLFKFWTFEIDELFVLDGQHYRLPEVNPN